MKVSSIKTAILVEDEADYRAFLIAKGFENFHLVRQSSGRLTYTFSTLYIYFDNAAEIMKYKLRDIEGQFIAIKKNGYFNDLDDSWDAETARELFGDRDY